MTYHGIKWQKKRSGTRRRDRKRNAGTKTSNGVGDVGKEGREGGRENEREREMRSIFIHTVSTN